MKRFPPWLPLSAVLVSSAVALASTGASAASAQERFRRTPPLPDAFEELQLPAIETISLSNGLRVAVTRRPGSPLLTLQVVISAGEVDSPANLPGLATLTARMMGRGGRTYSADDMENMVESIGGDFSAKVSMDYTVLTLHLPDEFMDRGLQLLKLMVLEPDFPELEFRTVKRIYYYELQDKKKDPEFTGLRELLRILFEGHPYQTGTYNEDVLKSITTKDLAAFYRRFYVPNNSVLIVSGDIDAASAALKISQYFNIWVSRDVERPVLTAPDLHSKQRVCFIDHPVSREVVIFVGNLVMPPRAPDCYPFLVLNQILGGTTGSRLFMDLRESKGYAYRAFSGTEFFRVCGVCWAKAWVPIDKIYLSVQEIMKILNDLSSAKVEPAEVEEAKSYLIGNLPLQFGTLEGYAARLAQVMALGLGDAFWNKTTDNLMLVNADGVLQAAQKYFPHPPVVVIVGNRQWIGEALRDFPEVEIYDSSGVFKMILRKGAEHEAR
jgi:predicted Zn-dependent peptidase